MVGYVTTHELNNNDLESGSVVVLEREDTLEICTLQHMTKDGDWIIMGQTVDNYKVGAADKLCKLIIQAPTNYLWYPLKFNQWSNAIRNGEVNSKKNVEFMLVPVDKFKGGKHVKECSICDAAFMGAGYQTQCKSCCEKEVTAKILISKTVKPKRPRLVKDAFDPRAIAVQAYEMGKKGKNAKQFIAWLDKQF